MTHRPYVDWAALRPPYVWLSPACRL